MPGFGAGSGGVVGRGYRDRKPSEVSASAFEGVRSVEGASDQTDSQRIGGLAGVGRGGAGAHDVLDQAVDVEGRGAIFELIPGDESGSRQGFEGPVVLALGHDPAFAGVQGPEHELGHLVGGEAGEHAHDRLGLGEGGGHVFGAPGDDVVEGEVEGGEHASVGAGRELAGGRVVPELGEAPAVVGEGQPAVA